jgi:hypothetical protein
VYNDTQDAMPPTAYEKRKTKTQPADLTTLWSAHQQLQFPLRNSQSIDERDFSAQETAYLLLGLPLYQCTYNFITLSLYGGNLSTCNSGNSVVNLSTLDMYRRRPRLDLNLLQLSPYKRMNPREERTL